MIWAEAADVGDAASTDAVDTVYLIDVAEAFLDEEDVDVGHAILVAADTVNADATDADADIYVVDTVSLDSASFICCTLLL